MSIEIYLQTLINGLFLGGIYSLVAMGLTLIYGVMVLVNFAHGEFLMIGLYLTFWTFTLFQIDPYVALPLIALILFIFGAFTQRVLIQPLLKAPSLNQILATMGLSIFLIGSVQMAWGAQSRNILVPYSPKGFHIAGLVFNYPKLAAFVIAIIVAISLYLFLNRTKTGKAIRAVSQNRKAAQLMGINVNRIFVLTFAIGTGLTGIAGVLISPSQPAYPIVGNAFSLTAFVIVVMGSMGNFIGAFFSSLIIGVAESYGGLFFGSDIRQIVSMGIFILLLLFKPEGLFGRKQS